MAVRECALVVLGHGGVTVRECAPVVLGAWVVWLSVSGLGFVVIVWR